jgi:TonB family C-terminal domain
MKKVIIFIFGIICLTSFIQGSGFNNTKTGYEVSYTASNADTTIYDVPYYTAELQDAIDYFRQNNKFKDWDKNNPKKVYLQGVVEINGTINNVRIVRASNVKELDDESLRLIKSAKYSPGKNDTGEDVRSKFSIIVSFPAN